jgi:hypothetical protein
LLVNTDHLSEKLTRSSAFFCGHYELKPFFGYPEPRIFVECTYRTLCLLTAFLSLLAESDCITVGHSPEIMSKSELRPLLFSNGAPGALLSCLADLMAVPFCKASSRAKFRK